MTEGAVNAAPSALTSRELWKDRTLAPGGGRFHEVARRFLPLVNGISASLILENPGAAETVSTAVFETLAFRWKGIPRKLAVATWLVRTTCFAATQERKRLGLKSKSRMPACTLAQRLFKAANRLPRRHANAFVLCSMLNEAPENVARALGVTRARVETWNAKAVEKVTKTLRRATRKLGISAPAFSALAVAPAPEVEGRILAKLCQWSVAAQREPLVQQTIAAWRWLAVGRFFKRLAATVAIIILALFTFALTAKFLIDRGHVNMAMIFIATMQRNMLKEFPEMGLSAKPWPANAEEMALASRKTPENSAELYGLTNIWLAKLRFTREQWKRVQADKIPPAQNLPDGKMALRNSKASRSGLAGALGIDFPWSEAAFEFGGKHFDTVGVRFRGNGTYLNSLYGNKVSYKVDLNRVKKGQQVGGVTTLNFVNAIPDYSYLRDALGEKIFRELGAVAPRTTYAYLTVDAPGKMTNQPLGLYVLVEDIDGNFAKDRFGTKDVPIFKPVTYDLFGDAGKDWSAYKDVYDLKTKATKEQLARVVELAQLVSHANDEEFARKLPDFLDLEEYAAFVAGHVLLSSYDGYLSNGQNFYMYLDPRSNKFGFIPWDQDHAWGEFGYVDTAEHREQASIWKPAAYKNKFLARVMKVEAFREVYRKKLEQGLAGPFTVEGLNRDIDGVAAVIRPAIAAESEFRLKRFEIAISTNWVSGPRDMPRDSGMMEGPKAPAHQLKRFVLARTQSLREQLDGKSEGVVIRGWGQ